MVCLLEAVKGAYGISDPLLLRDLWCYNWYIMAMDKKGVWHMALRLMNDEPVVWVK